MARERSKYSPEFKDEAVRFVGEEQNRPGNFIRFRPAAERMDVADGLRIGRFLEVTFGQRCAHDAGCNRVDAHAFVPEFQCHLARQADDAVFGSRIGSAVRRSHQAKRGGEVDDLAGLALLDDVAGEGLARQERAGESCEFAPASFASRT